ncbi:kinase-like protein [Dendrothele bispora CBS 962.96]|uniref:non-specific serine/threonine protein kinase n=1 Tax=Dendrothele bispora (strain CBS 962.96) TaxID=1314807 RepID=A0A4S8M729_DENBC|nr:kinase-like protein [Dendrothele bispora CBS 962.96]
MSLVPIDSSTSDWQPVFHDELNNQVVLYNPSSHALTIRPFSTAGNGIGGSRTGLGLGLGPSSSSTSTLPVRWPPQRPCPYCKQVLPAGFVYSNDHYDIDDLDEGVEEGNVNDEYDGFRHRHRHPRRRRRREGYDGGIGGSSGDDDDELGFRTRSRLSRNYFNILAIANENRTTGTISEPSSTSASGSSSIGSSRSVSPSTSSFAAASSSSRVSRSASPYGLSLERQQQEQEEEGIGFVGPEPTLASASASASLSADSGNENNNNNVFPPGSMAEGYFNMFFKEEWKLGMGANGSVFLCQHVLDGNSLGRFAVKKIAVGQSHSYLLQTLREVKLLERLHHPNIITYHHAWLETCQFSAFGPKVPTLHVLMQWAEGGSLDDLIDVRLGRDLRNPHISLAPENPEPVFHFENHQNQNHHCVHMNSGYDDHRDGDDDGNRDGDLSGRNVGNVGNVGGGGGGGIATDAEARKQAFRAMQRASTPGERERLRAKLFGAGTINPSTPTVPSSLGPEPSSPHSPQASSSRPQPQTTWNAIHLLSSNEIRSLFGDIVQGLSFLHSKSILHGDLKPGNVLLTWDYDASSSSSSSFSSSGRGFERQWGHGHGSYGHGYGYGYGYGSYGCEDFGPVPRAMLSDFGTSRDMIRPVYGDGVEGGGGGRTGNTGTLEYAAPETLPSPITGLLSEITSKADMWSLGMVLHKMLFFRLPYFYASSGGGEVMYPPFLDNEGPEEEVEGRENGGGKKDKNGVSFNNVASSVNVDHHLPLPRPNIPHRPLSERTTQDLLQAEILAYPGFKSSPRFRQVFRNRRLKENYLLVLENLLSVEPGKREGCGTVLRAVKRGLLDPIVEKRRGGDAESSGKGGRGGVREGRKGRVGRDEEGKELWRSSQPIFSRRKRGRKSQIPGGAREVLFDNEDDDDDDDDSDLEAAGSDYSNNELELSGSAGPLVPLFRSTVGMGMGLELEEDVSARPRAKSQPPPVKSGSVSGPNSGFGVPGSDSTKILPAARAAAEFLHSDVGTIGLRNRESVQFGGVEEVVESSGYLEESEETEETEETEDTIGMDSDHEEEEDASHGDLSLVDLDQSGSSDGGGGGGGVSTNDYSGTSLSVSQARQQVGVGKKNGSPRARMGGPDIGRIGRVEAGKEDERGLGSVPRESRREKRREREETESSSTSAESSEESRSWWVTRVGTGDLWSPGRRHRHGHGQLYRPESSAAAARYGWDMTEWQWVYFWRFMMGDWYHGRARRIGRDGTGMRSVGDARPVGANSRDVKLWSRPDQIDEKWWWRRWMSRVPRPVWMRTLKSCILILKVINLPKMCSHPHDGILHLGYDYSSNLSQPGKLMTAIVVLFAVIDTWFDGFWISIVFGVIHLGLVRLGCFVGCCE